MTPAPEPQNARAADPAERYDVAVLGGTLAGGLLAAVLARQGVRVLVVNGPDDRDAYSGETTVPYTAEVFLLLAKRFEVPEIAAFGLFSDLPAEVRRTSGVKKSLGFLYHRENRRHDPRESVQFNVPGEHAEWHLYRADVDAYTLRIAARYGAAVAPRHVTVTDAEAGPDGGEVRTSDGSLFRARYLVDVTGDRSPLVRRAGGDDAVPGLRHRSVTYSAHLRDVTHFEDVVPMSRHAKCTTWSEGTVHHLFEGGWLQMVRFANHREGDNPITSVTLSVDPEVAAGLSDDPEKAARTVIERYPDIARQFTTAVPVRAWTSQPQGQRTAAQCRGERWFALERSAARTDMFLSRDVTQAAETVHALAAALVPAVRQDDFAEAPFARVARFQTALTDWNDRLLAGARTACRDFDLWNAYSRVWLLWQILADLSLKRARLDCEQDGDWKPVERFELGGIWFRAPAGLREMVDDSMAAIEEVRAGRRDSRTVAAEIFANLRRARWVPPLYAFGDPAARVYHFTFPKRLRMLWWVKTKAPADFKRLLTRDNVTSVTSESSR